MNYDIIIVGAVVLAALVYALSGLFRRKGRGAKGTQGSRASCSCSSAGSGCESCPASPSTGGIADLRKKPKSS